MQENSVANQNNNIAPSKNQINSKAFNWMLFFVDVRHIWFASLFFFLSLFLTIPGQNMMSMYKKPVIRHSQCVIGWMYARWNLMVFSVEINWLGLVWGRFSYGKNCVVQHWNFANNNEQNHANFWHSGLWSHHTIPHHVQWLLRYISADAFDLS